MNFTFFFDAICAKRYAAAYDLLYDYASLGLEEQPQSCIRIPEKYDFMLYEESCFSGLGGHLGVCVCG